MTLLSVADSDAWRSDIGTGTTGTLRFFNAVRYYIFF